MRGYIFLNIIRVCSITTLVMAVAAAMATLTKSFILSRYFLFDTLNNIILSVFCTFLFFSELDFFPSYYQKHWPLFGPDSSLVGVGVAEVIIGFQLLGNLNGGNGSKENIGHSFNALLMAAGIIVSVTGVAVFITSYVYSNSQTHVTARQVRSRAYNILDKSKDLIPVTLLEDVRVVGELPKLERPQRAYSNSSGTPCGARMARSNSVTSIYSLGGTVGKSASVTSSRGPFPYASERGMRESYSSPSATTHERNHIGASEVIRAPSSIYSQACKTNYGNPYSQPPYA